MTAAPDPRPAPEGGMGVHRCQAVGRQVLDELVRVLTEQADDQGKVSLTTVRAVVTRLESRDSSLAPVFNQVFEDCNSLMEARRHAHRRRDSFSRAVIARMDHLFSRAGARAEERLPRYVIPGMVTVLTMALGEERLAIFRAACEEIVREHRERHGENFQWQRYFDDPRVERVVIQALLVMAGHFANFEQRTTWLRSVLEHEGLQRTGHDRFQPLTDPQILALLAAVFGTFDPDSPMVMEEGGRYGQQLLADLQHRIAQERRRRLQHGP